MDLLTVIIIVLVAIAFVLVGILNKKYKKMEQGRIGEVIVSKKLTFWLKSSSYILNDITLPTPNGGTTQIDHLVISTRGIFCIETKNLNGMIHGNKDDQNWTHRNQRGDKNNLFNPIKQNRGHISHVARILQIPSGDIKGFVVNVGNAKLKGDIKPFFSKPLIEVGTGFIFRLWRLPKNAISVEQVEIYLSRIQDVALEQNRKTAKLHVKNVKNRYK